MKSEEFATAIPSPDPTGTPEGNSSLFTIHYSLNRQHRTWPLTYGWQGDTLLVTCKEATYRIPRSVVETANTFCWDIPADGAAYGAKGTFAFVSRQAMDELKKNDCFVYDGITWRNVGDIEDGPVHVRADIDQTEMLIEYSEDTGLYMVTEIRHNPLGIDWKIQRIE